MDRAGTLLWAVFMYSQRGTYLSRVYAVVLGHSVYSNKHIVSDFRLNSLLHHPAYLKMLEETKHDQKLP
ncbi:hypothetical protein TNCV_3838411 [Trichonephila clavipes]|nr:hypothetical protein TNCV_3838411 [Trichonephila clavipes]